MLRVPKFFWKIHHFFMYFRVDDSSLNGSLRRRFSKKRSSSSEKMQRQTSQAKDAKAPENEKQPKAGEKLIEAEKAETGRVSMQRIL